MTKPIPCRICGCIDGEPGLCHALTPNGRACFRVPPHKDWCSACATWDKEFKRLNPVLPIEALAAHYRGEKADEAADKRGASVPGSYALRVHAARMRRLAFKLAVDVGVLKAPPDKPVKERDLPLSP